MIYRQREGVHMQRSLLMALGMLASTGCLAADACKDVDVRSLHVLALGAATPSDWRQAGTLEITRAPNGPVQAVSLGPVLGSMDSAAVRAGWTCSDGVLEVTAVITRSADYTGATRQNQNWLPRMSFELTHCSLALVVKTTWRLRRSDGTSLTQATTPPLTRPQAYPLSTSKTLDDSLH
jgi:hypothetical protein